MPPAATEASRRSLLLREGRRMASSFVARLHLPLLPIPLLLLRQTGTAPRWSSSTTARGGPRPTTSSRSLRRFTGERVRERERRFQLLLSFPASFLSLVDDLSNKKTKNFDLVTFFPGESAAGPSSRSRTWSWPGEFRLRKKDNKTERERERFSPRSRERQNKKTQTARRSATPSPRRPPSAPPASSSPPTSSPAAGTSARTSRRWPARPKRPRGCP